MRFFTAGESHGPMLTAILEGMPAGLPFDMEDIDRDLSRRQQGYGSGGRMQIEKDKVRVTGGVMNGMTTGSPISLIVENRDFKNWRERDITPITTPRPGHADLTGAIKYGYRELRLSLERASARETTMRVAVGAICKRFLAEFGIEIVGYVSQLGDVVAQLPSDPDYRALYEAAETNDVRCPDPEAAEAMHAAIRQVKIDKDTLGGIFEVVALNVPPGLGSHVQFDRKLDAKLVAAMVSIQAMKGAEIGHAFKQAGLPGSQVHDEIDVDEKGAIHRRTNRAGGLEGGITTGDPIVVRVAMKPISTMLRGADSVNLATGEADRTAYERSDFCALPRAVPIGESMMAIVLADALLEKLGGDSIEEMKPRFDALRGNRLADVPMDNVEWRFGYE
ncbi:chorismate synthase [Phototrophicus methaneseepsis]|uniref:Chorismate synthase n=1 Tax=Phototrophicus methaneseepsis TaxID=2710758 RepID=A0A7S8EEA8_9CHLR|nr:chorismate synthase [Phototrophicus methaneseepsis]